MARQKRKAGSKPITSHQLFPAVVALWFGALFGLGSLAVRPSLLESAVIASRIDLVSPAAAPPLGVTARILVALVLAAIGSTIGLIIARRLARSKPDVRERKRTRLADRDEAAPRHTNRPAHAEAKADEPAGSVPAQRRRALTIEHGEEDFVPHEMAPLPGGAPQILDISKVGFEAQAPQAPLDPDTYQAAPASREFQPQPLAEAPPPAGHAAMADPFPADAPRQIFGQPVKGEHVDQSFVQAAGFKTSVFQAETPEPLFPPRCSAPEADPVVPQFTVPPAPPVESFAVPPITEATFAAADSEEQPAPGPVAMAPSATPPEPLPSPAGLGMTDLASRLAESMARRRAARAAAAGGVTAQVAAAPAPAPEPAPVPSAAPILPKAPSPAPFAAASASEPAQPVPAAPAPAAIPAAMRPLDLDGFEEEGEPLSSLLPPRHIAMPAAAPAAAPEQPPFAMPQAITPGPDPQPEAESAEETAEEEPVAEDRFGSLLGVPIQPSGPRAGLVRIAEPEADSTEIEPVVIFPGQMASPQAEETAPFRPFDAPAHAEPGQPIAAGNAAPSVNREEAERALRMALANLQRMSGAA
ncbi:MAG: hypothetical protein ACK4YM_02925 [Novosphingobium sp.]